MGAGSNQEFRYQNDDQGLSLCDLTLNEHEDFDFWAGRNLPETKMCSADELFYKGKIIPGLMTRPTGESTRSLLLSKSKISVGSDSSRRSDASSSSISSSTSGFEIFTRYKPGNRSIKPQIIRKRAAGYSSNPKTTRSSKCRFFRLGMRVTPQEISLEKVKTRSHDQNQKIKKSNKNKKKNKMLSLFRGCKCSVNVIESTISSTMMIKNNMNKSLERKQQNAVLTTKDLL